MPDNFENKQLTVLRRRKGDKGIEKVRIEDGGKTIIPQKSDVSTLSEQEKKAMENKAMEERLQKEIKGFLAQKK